MKKKNKVLLILCSIFVCIASVFSFLPFVKNNDSKINVYADTISSSYLEFNGSNLYMIGTPYWDNSVGYYIDRTGIILKSFDFYIDPTINRLVGFQINVTASDWIKRYSSFVTFPTSSSNFMEYKVWYSTDINTGAKAYYTTWAGFSNNVNGVVTFGVPVGVTISSSVSGSTSVLTKIIYFDKAGNTVTFNTYGYVGDYSQSSFPISDYLYDERTYYFSNSIDFTDNEFYNQGYSAGQSAGYNDGYNKGQSNGYSEGYNVGENVGYNNGYNEGVQDSNQYTFLNLISATIDAPVSYFQSLFNFELLGVNLQGFLTGLFTLCVIITIVKLCLGG